MPESTNKTKSASLSMDNEAFVKLWVQANERDEDDTPSQRDWLVNACYDLFVVGAMSSENKAFLDAYEGLTESAMKAEVKARVMSKLYSLTRSFKDAGYTEIKMPQKGKTKTQAKTSELAKLLGLKKSTK